MLTSLLFLAAVSRQPADPLAEGFRNPPGWARPHTWWHWMDGNVTKEGITADLEAMKEVGIGGAQMFTVSQNIPPGPAGYNGPLWRALTTHAVREAARLGIELCIHNCAGWSSSGGPWIAPQDAMQVLAWSERKVRGPSHFDDRLPAIVAPHLYAKVDYSRDIAVYAFRTPAGSSAEPDLGRTGVERADGLVPALGPGAGVPLSGFVDLTDRLRPDGTLIWDVPEGDWTILRMGHVPTGKDNHPAPPEGDGLEVDKLSREALDHHWQGMMAKVIADVGPLAGKVLNNSLIDSYEVGSQNWTPKFREEFRRRRGYDPMPYLPAITGLVVGSKDTTERFLWDYRRTIADLFADNYYGHFAQLCHTAGLQFSTEPYGNGGFDNIQSGSKADIPMGEFWIGGAAMETAKLAASVAHVYGRKVVGAESFTADEVRGRWLEEPYAQKALGDWAFSEGINRYIFHRYAQQPWLDVKPGMTMGPWGTHLERTQTWWTEAKEWLKYVARSQYLLQSGRFVADVCYFYGEDAPADLPSRGALNPPIPKGYDYDGCDANALLSMRYENGRLVLPSGMSYRVLALPNRTFMTPRVIRKVRDLVNAGATVWGPKPEHSPSLSGFPASEDEVKRMADEVWGAGSAGSSHAYGRGRVFWGSSLEPALDAVKLTPDIAFKAASPLLKFASIHRKVGSADFYFVSNQSYRRGSVDVSFRVSGLRPELWHADTGQIEEAPVYQGVNGRTSVRLNLNPAESVFVVFRKAQQASHFTGFVARVAGTVTAFRIPKIEILRARYESADGRGADVTATVRQFVAAGEMEVPATNDVFGDPVRDVVKRLAIDYTVDGKPFRKVVPENDTLTLFRLANEKGAATDYDLRLRSDGALEITPWKPAIFNVTRAGGQRETIRADRFSSDLDLSRDWNVRFAPKLGAPASARFAKLISWPEHSNPGIRYFSGSATYDKDVDVPARMLAAGRSVRLDLGVVKNFATVTVNGRELGVLWKPPFTLDVTRALHAGRNRISVKVTNLWPNRIIGDEQLPPEVEWDGNHLKAWPAWLKPGDSRIADDRPKTGRVTFTTWRYYTKDSPLLDSGLLGPVLLQSAAPRVVIGKR